MNIKDASVLHNEDEIIWEETGEVCSVLSPIYMVDGCWMIDVITKESNEYYSLTINQIN